MPKKRFVGVRCPACGRKGLLHPEGEPEVVQCRYCKSRYPDDMVMERWVRSEKVRKYAKELGE